MKSKSKGNILDFVSIMITILAMSIMVMAYLECTNLLMKKMEIGQISRKYILKMETDGYLTEQLKGEMLQELYRAGLRGIDLSGTTLHPVTYGDAVFLKIKGSVAGRILGNVNEMWNSGFKEGLFTVEEERMSTAKN